MTGEFHIHSIASDGVLKVEEILDYVDGKRDYIAITDHDILDASIKAWALTHNPNSSYKVKSLIGVEVSTESNEESVHILGYFNSVENLSPLIEAMDRTRKNRVERLYKMKELLYKHFNIDLDLENLLSLQTITRGSIGREIKRQGYNYTTEEIFGKMIGHNCPAYVRATKMTTELGIKLIHDCGGMAVLAHPTLLKRIDPVDIVKLGIDGIEAVYPNNKEGDEERFRKIAHDYNLVVTGGSDFHAFNDGKHGNLLEHGIEGKELETLVNKIYNLGK